MGNKQSHAAASGLTGDALLPLESFDARFIAALHGHVPDFIDVIPPPILRLIVEYVRVASIVLYGGHHVVFNTRLEHTYRPVSPTISLNPWLDTSLFHHGFAHVEDEKKKKKKKRDKGSGNGNGNGDNSKREDKKQKKKKSLWITCNISPPPFDRSSMHIMSDSMTMITVTPIFRWCFQRLDICKWVNTTSSINRIGSNYSGAVRRAHVHFWDGTKGSTLNGDDTGQVSPTWIDDIRLYSITMHARVPYTDTLYWMGVARDHTITFSCYNALTNEWSQCEEKPADYPLQLMGIDDHTLVLFSRVQSEPNTVPLVTSMMPSMGGQYGGNGGIGGPFHHAPTPSYIQLYNTRSQSWTKLPPSAGMPSYPHNARTIVVPGICILLIGGDRAAGSFESAAQSTQIYRLDLRTYQWITTSLTTPIPRLVDFAVELVDESIIMIMGGRDRFSQEIFDTCWTCDVRDPNNTTWLTHKQLRLPQPTYGMTSTSWIG